MNLPRSKNQSLLESGYHVSKMIRHWRLPKGYTLQNLNLDGLPIEILISPNINNHKIILQFHGGAYIMRFFDLYRMIAYQYSKISNGAKVVSIDYHTAPYHTYPHAHNDALKVWQYLINQGYNAKDIIIVGDSAGGNLALSLTMKLRDENKALPKALVLLSPWTDFSAEGDSYKYNLHKDCLLGIKKGKNLQNSQMHQLIRAYAGNTDFKHPYLSPVYGNFSNFPPMLMIVGSFDLLESDSIKVYEKAKSENVDVTLSRYYGMFHDFPLLLNFIPESKKAWIEVKNFINLHFQD